MSPTDHVRTLRDYFNRAIAHGSEAHFDPDDAEDIAEYIEKLKTEVAEMQSKVIAVRLAAKCAAKIRDDHIEKLEEENGVLFVANVRLNSRADLDCDHYRDRIKELEAALRACHSALNVAFEYDGNVFGFAHNDAVDADILASKALEDK